VDEAHCTSRTDDTKLREIIEAGGKFLFEQTIRGLVGQADAAQGSPAEASRGAFCGCALQN